MATKTKPTINPTERRVAAAELVIAAKAAKEAANAAYEESLAAFLRTCPDEGVLEFAGHRVTITQTGTRSFDVDALAGLVDETTFDAVTKISVDTKAFDGCVMLGDITPDVVEQVVTVNPSVRVTVR